MTFVTELLFGSFPLLREGRETRVLSFLLGFYGLLGSRHLASAIEWACSLPWHFEKLSVYDGYRFAGGLRRVVALAP